MSLSSQHGWLVVGFIALLSSAFIAMTGVSMLSAHNRQAVSLTANQTEAVYLAQAGVMRAVFAFRRDDGLRLGEQAVDAGPAPGLSDDDVFILGGKARDFLLANMIPAAWATGRICGGPPTRQHLQRWSLRNVLQMDSPPDGLPVAIDRLQIAWHPDNGERLLRVDLMGNAADWSSCAGIGSGETIDLVPNQAVNPLARGTNRIWFSSRTTNPPALRMDLKEWIELRFIMSDHLDNGNPLEASIRLARYTLAPSTRSASFTVKATGEVRKGAFPFIAWRRLQAEYRICAVVPLPAVCDTEAEERTQAGSVLSYQELASKTP